MKKIKQIKSYLNNLHEWQTLTDNNTWEVIVIKENVTNVGTYFKPKRSNFMKVWQEPKELIKVKSYLWWFFQYLPFLSCYCDNWNRINFKDFREDLPINMNSFCSMKKRMSEYWIINKYKWQWYLNPIIAVKSENIKTELWIMFKDKNEKFYWVINL
jgi:hypothetical protein